MSDIIHASRGIADDPWANSPALPAMPTGQPMGMGGYTGGGLGSGKPPLQRIHRVLRGRYVVAAALALIGGGIGAWYGWSSEAPAYKTSGNITFKPYIQRLDGSERVMGLYAIRMNTEAQKLRNRDTVIAAMSRAEWREAKGWPATEAGVLAFMNALKSDSAAQKSFFINVSFEHADPMVARAGVTSILNSFRDKYSRTTQQSVDQRARTIDEARAKSSDKIRELQDGLGEYTKIYGTTDLTTTHQAQISERTGLNQTITKLEAQLDAMRKVEEQAKTLESASLTSEELARLDPEQRLRPLLDERRSLDSQLRTASIGALANNQVVAGLRQRIATLEQQIEVESRRIRADAFGIIPNFGGNGEPIIVTRRSIDTQSQLLSYSKKQLADLETSMRSLAADRAKIDAINHEIDRLNADAQKFTAMSEGLEVDRLMNAPMDDIEVGDTVVSNDKRKTMAAFGFVLGASGPLALVMLLGLLDTRFRYSDDAGGGMAGLKLLGILPNLPDRLSDPQQASIAAHCVHQIRTMLQLDMDRDNPTSLCITSAASGDGKTSLCLALGLSFAASGSRTLLIDADLVGGGLSNRLGRADSPDGVLDAITDGDLLNHSHATDVQDLSILPVGQAHVQHAGVFSPSAMRRLIAEAKKHFEVILVDTGPLMGAIEATPVCASVDGVILAVSRGQSRPLVDKSLEHLRGIGARIAGIVFNRAQAKDFARSISGMSVRSAARSAANGKGHNRRPAGAGVDPVASAVRGSVNGE